MSNLSERQIRQRKKAEAIAAAIEFEFHDPNQPEEDVSQWETSLIAESMMSPDEFRASMIRYAGVIM